MLSRFIVFFIAFSVFHPAVAFEDATEGQPFFPWLWERQIKPTARESADVDGFGILLGTTVATITARQYDGDMRAEYGDNRHMPTSLSKIGSVLGSGYPGVAIGVAQLLWDQPNGLITSRAILFTAASHFTIATIAGRERPNNGPRSFPSGHTSTAFTIAGALAYEYGWWVGVPALATATFIGASRMADNAHWFSDTIAAAGLGLFWARASAQAGLEKGSLTPKEPAWTPVLLRGGIALQFKREF